MKGIFGEMGKEAIESFKKNQRRQTAFHFLLAMTLFNLNDKAKRSRTDAEEVNFRLEAWRESLVADIEDDFTKEETDLSFLRDLFGMDAKKACLDVVDEVFETFKNAIEAEEPAGPALEWIAGKKKGSHEEPTS